MGVLPTCFRLTFIFPRTDWTLIASFATNLEHHSPLQLNPSFLAHRSNIWLRSGTIIVHLCRLQASTKGGIVAVSSLYLPQISQLFIMSEEAAYDPEIVSAYQNA